jgi:hypothetical protein
LGNWRQHLRASLGSNASPISVTTLPDEIISRLTCSLFGSEASHPNCNGLTQEEFEVSCAPKLYKFLALHVKRFASNRHQNLPWKTSLAIVCHCDTLVRLYSEQKDTLHHPDLGTDNDICRQLLEEVVISACHSTEENSVRIPLPGSIRGGAGIDTNAFEEKDGVLARFLDNLSSVMVHDYLSEPSSSEWMFELNRPVFDLSRDWAGHGHHHVGHHFANRHHESAIGTARALQEFKNLQFSPAELSLERLRRLDSRWTVAWTSACPATWSYERRPSMCTGQQLVSRGSQGERGSHPHV